MMSNDAKILEEIERADGTLAPSPPGSVQASPSMTEFGRDTGLTTAFTATSPGIDWNPQKTERLIDLFENEVPLWNTEHPKHLDRDERRAALVRISKELKIPSSEVEKKLRGLRSYYSRELSKIHESIRNSSGPGSFYVSPWVFFARLSFLSNFVHPRPPKRAFDSCYLDNSDLMKVEFDSEESESLSNQHLNTDPSEDLIANLDGSLLKKEHCEELALQTRAECSITQPLRKKSRYNRDLSVDEGFLYPSIRTAQSDGESGDEDLCFGRHVALSLKKMSHRTKELAKLQIQQVLYECYVTQAATAAAAAASSMPQQSTRTLSPSPSTSSDYSSF